MPGYFRAFTLDLAPQYPVEEVFIGLVFLVERESLRLLCAKPTFGFFSSSETARLRAPHRVSGRALTARSPQRTSIVVELRHRPQLQNFFHRRDHVGRIHEPVNDASCRSMAK